MPPSTKISSELCEVTKDVYALVHNQDDSIHTGFGSNQAFVVLEESVLIFDTGFSTLHAEYLDRAIGQVTDKSVRYIINSHDHSDHVFGNSYFSKKYSVSIISHEVCALQVRRFGGQRLQNYKKHDRRLTALLSEVEIDVPDLTYAETGLRLKVEGTDFMLVHPENGAHTLGDTIVAIPRKGVMMLGDVLVNSYFPNVEDSNIESWIDFLSDVDHETYTKFVPGHGTLCGKDQVQHFERYLRTIRDRLLFVDPRQEIEKLRSCFEAEGTNNWKCRSAVDRNIESLLGKFR